jgi:hypothetical protein
LNQRIQAQRKESRFFAAFGRGLGRTKFTRATSSNDSNEQVEKQTWVGGAHVGRCLRSEVVEFGGFDTRKNSQYNLLRDENGVNLWRKSGFLLTQTLDARCDLIKGHLDDTNADELRIESGPSRVENTGNETLAMNGKYIHCREMDSVENIAALWNECAPAGQIRTYGLRNTVSLQDIHLAPLRSFRN